MRGIALATVASAALALSPAAAQQGATRTTDDYVCAFAGQCADGAGEAEAPQATRPGTPRVSNNNRGFSLARPNGTSASTPARKAGTKAPAPKRAAGVTVAQRPAAAQGQRADLRLSFNLGSADLTPVARAEAKVFAESLKRPELQGMKFVIEGHTDSQGGRAYNMDLSRRRAQAVSEYLVGEGVSPDRLDVRGYGFDRPLPGRSAAAQENRRVEAVRVS